MKEQSSELIVSLSLKVNSQQVGTETVQLVESTELLAAAVPYPGPGS